MAAIPDAGGARCAPCGVTRALLPRVLLRVALLGGLIITGWLLGSGIAQASASSGLSGVNEGRIASLSPLNAAETDDGADGLLGVPAPRLPAQPAKLRVLEPVLKPAKLPVLDPVLKPVSKLAAPVAPNAGKAARPWAAAEKPAVVVPPAPPAAPPAPAAPAELAVPATSLATPAPVPHPVSEAASETPVCVAAAPVADPSADRSTGPTALGPSERPSGPADPVGPSPPGTTTAPCPLGSTGAGAITKSLHPVTLSDGWSATSLTPTHCRLCAGADGILPSAAQRPSTPPD